MIFMKAFLSKISIFIPSPSKWGSFFLLVVVIFAASMVEATPSFQKFKNDSDSSVHFKLKAIIDPESIKSRGRFALYVKIELSEGWHIYSLNAEKYEEAESLATDIVFDSNGTSWASTVVTESFNNQEYEFLFSLCYRGFYLQYSP